MSKIIDSEIKVVCKKTKSKVLIVGATYSAIQIHSSLPFPNIPIKRYIFLKNIGPYDISINSFELLDGTPVNNLKDFNTIPDNNRIFISDKDYTNQYVMCRYSDGSKYLKENEIYLVEKQIDKKFKIKGIKTKLSSFRFSEIPISDQRNIKLKNISGETIKTGIDERKFLSYSDKDKFIIIFGLMNSILNSTINAKLNSKLDIIKLICEKGEKFNIIEEDVVFFFEDNLYTLIDKYLY
jgi:hypothetical protein